MTVKNLSATSNTNIFVKVLKHCFRLQKTIIIIMAIAFLDLNNIDERKKQTAILNEIGPHSVAIFPAFLKSVQDTYNLNCLYITCFDNGRLYGVGAFYERRDIRGRITLVSLPGGFYAVNHVAEKEMIKSLNNYTKDKDMNGPVFCDLQVPLQALNSQNIYFRAVKHLNKDEKDVTSSFSKNIRRDYKTAKKKGLRLVESKDVAAFYEVWARNMRDLGTPPMPISFFLNLQKNFQESIDVLLVKKSDKTIGGAFVIQSGDYAINLFASSLKSYFKFYPNIFLYYEMIIWACRNGIETFDLGRSQPGSGNEKFKLRFGSKLFPLYTYPGLINSRRKLMINSILAGTWKYVPVKASNILGPYIRNYIPFG
jgi:hypothetical protein